MEDTVSLRKQTATHNNNSNSNISTISLNINVDDSDSLALVKEHVLFYFTLVNWIIVCKAVSVFGVLSNTINMAVFIKTGFKDSITISLFALAISDLGSCFTLIFSTIALNPWFQKVDTSVVWHEVQYLIACWPHVGFTKTTTLITAFITFERCLCVSVPLKVKTIITKKRVIIYLVTAFAFVFGFMIPVFYSNRLGNKFDSHTNQTLFGLVLTPDRQAIENVIFFVYAFMSMLPFVFIIISTILLVVKLKEKLEWRQKATSNVKQMEANDSVTKEQRVSKMVVIISTLFIVCFFPTAALQLTVWLDRRVNVDGIYSNLNVVLAYFTFSFESLNSALNIVIYYKNSSNYKAVFDKMFFFKRNQNKQQQSK